MNAQDVLAGPIVRRVEPTLVAVWVALRVPATARLRMFRGVGRVDELGLEVPGNPLEGIDVRTFAAGAQLHIALATFVPVDGGPLDAGEIYSYDVRLTPDGGAEVGLGDLGLLDDVDIPSLFGGPPHRHLALGYKKDVLPSFVVPPPNPYDLKLVHGSCRHVSDAGRDAMPILDELMRIHQSDRKLRPHLCVLHGDQIYADSSPPEFTQIANELGAELISGVRGTGIETFDVDLPQTGSPTPKRHTFPLDGLHFPPGRRSLLLSRCGFSAHSAHLVGLGEVFAAYLLHWSNVAWPPLEPLLQDRWPRVEAFRDAVQAVIQQGQGRSGFGGISDEIERHEAWRLIPPEARAIDAALAPADHEAAWAPDATDRDRWDAFWAGTPFTGPPGPTTLGPPPIPAAPGLAELAKQLTPSFWAGHKHFSVAMERTGEGTPTVQVNRDNVRTRLQRMHDFQQGLTEVRRGLANIAVYMVFDDHDVSDDWNITASWVRATRANALGRALIRNLLVGYTLFQHWGNDPRAYAREGPQRTLLNNISSLLFDGGSLRASVPDPSAAFAIERQLQLEPPDPPGGAPPGPHPPMVWHYRYDGPGFELIALDTRTDRGFEPEGGSLSPISAEGNPALLSAEALTAQVPEQPPVQAAEGYSLVIAATPMLGMQPVELLVQPILNHLDALRPPPRGRWAHLEKLYHAGRLENDPENFGFVAYRFEEILARLSTRPRVVFLSGDVHYTFTSSMSYFDDAAGRTTRFVQLTSSSVRKQRGAPEVDLFNTDAVQRLADVIAGRIERVGWRRGPLGSDTFDPPLEPRGTPFNARLLRLLQDELVVVAPQAVPVDIRIRRPPEWRWSMVLESDNRPDTERIPFLFEAPPLETDLALPTDIVSAAARRHAFEGAHVPPRRWMWWTNLCLVQFMGEGGTHAVRHSSFSFDLTGIDKTARAYMIVDVPLDGLGDPPQLPSERLEPPPVDA